MIQEEIDYFHPPKVSLKVVFAVWREKVPQGRRSGSSLGNGPQKLRRRLRDAVIAQQRFGHGNSCSGDSPESQISPVVSNSEHRDKLPWPAVQQRFPRVSLDV